MRMNKKWLVIPVFSLFLLQCNPPAKEDKAPAPANPALAADKKIILAIGDSSLTNLDLKNFIKLQYCGYF